MPNHSDTETRKGNTSHCTHPVSPALESWLSSLRFFLSREFETRHRVAARNSSFSNKIPLVDFGLRIGASNNFEAVANDKDGGNSLVDFEALLQLLKIGEYFESDWSNWDTRYMTAASSYIHHLTKRVESIT